MRSWASWTSGHPCCISKNVCLTQWTPVERTLMSSSLGDGCAPDVPSNEEGLRCWRAGSVLRHRAHWCCKQAEQVLLQSVWEGCIGSHSQRIRDNPAFPRTPPFRSRSTASPRDPWLASVRLRRQLAARRGTWETAREDYARPLVFRDWEYPFQEDLFSDASGNVDPQWPKLAKISCLLDALQLGGSYELVEKLWQRFVLSASRINVTVAWSHDEVLVSSVLSPDSKCSD